MVECDLAKVEVAGSNPVSRSNLRTGFTRRLSTIASRSDATVDRHCIPVLRLASHRLASHELEIDDHQNRLSRALLLFLRIDAGRILPYTKRVPTGAVAKW